MQSKGQNESQFCLKKRMKDLCLTCELFVKMTVNFLRENSIVVSLFFLKTEYLSNDYLGLCSILTKYYDGQKALVKKWLSINKVCMLACFIY